MRVMTAIAVAVVLWASPASADSRLDVGLLLGSTTTTDEDGTLRFTRATTYQATVDVLVWRSSAVTLGIEVPFTASPAFDIDSTVGSLPKEYASLYLTPGVRAFGRRAVRRWR